MAKTDFDNELQKKFAEEPLPFNEDQWQELQARLDKKERRVLLLPFVPATYRQMAVAATVVFAIVVIWLIVPQREKGIAEKNITVIEPKQPVASEVTPENNTDTILVATNATVKQVVKPRVINTTHDVIHDDIDTTTGVQQSFVEDDQPVRTTAQQRRQPKGDLHRFDFNELPQKYNNDISLSLNGGLTFIESGRGFQAGLAIKNSISHNISIETSVSYLHGSQHVFNRNERIEVEEVIISSDTGSYQSYDTTVVAWFERSSRNLPYAQLSTAMSLRLHKKLNISLGPDLQKVLLAGDNLAKLNDQLSHESKKVPSWDIGVGMRIQYALTKRIGCGVSYRESITDLVNPGDNYVNRDYVLFQLQYILVR